MSLGGQLIDQELLLLRIGPSLRHCVEVFLASTVFDDLGGHLLEVSLGCLDCGSCFALHIKGHALVGRGALEVARREEVIHIVALDHVAWFH